MRRIEPCDGAYWHSVPLRCSRCNGTESDHAPSEPAGMPEEPQVFKVRRKQVTCTDGVTDSVLSDETTEYIPKQDYDALRSWATALEVFHDADIERAEKAEAELAGWKEREAQANRVCSKAESERDALRDALLEASGYLTPCFWEIRPKHKAAIDAALAAQEKK